MSSGHLVVGDSADAKRNKQRKKKQSVKRNEREKPKKRRRRINETAINVVGQITAVAEGANGSWQIKERVKQKRFRKALRNEIKKQTERTRI